MRPVERGPVPLLPNGQPKTVADYKDWRADLVARLGPYCCYCNLKLNESPQVEHVVPKSLVPARRLDWDNMLLACGACNTIKSNHSCGPATHFLPDVHNTHLAFPHQLRPHLKMPGRIAGIIVTRAALSVAQQLKAQETIRLCGLARVEQSALQQRRASDLRWQYRFEADEYAARYRGGWDTLPTKLATPFLDILRDLVREKGFFSIWFDAFHDVPVVKQMLINTFPNTADCFPPPTFDPVERIPGDL